MAGAASVAAVVLAAILGWAAAAKLVRHNATVAAFASLKLPAPRTMSVTVPALEVGTGVVLLVRPVWGGGMALALLVGFSTILVLVVFRASGAGCGCFGSARSDPVGPADVLRNGMLAALAALATGTQRLIRPGWVAVLAVLGLVVVGAAMLMAVRRIMRGRVADP